MKTLTATLSLVAAATGIAGAAIAYASTAPQSSTQSSISAPAAPTPKASAATGPGVRIKFRFRKCGAGAQLEHGKCVRHVVRTVVEPARVTAVASSTSNHPTARSRDEHGDGSREARQSAGEHRDDQAEGSEGDSVDAPETDD